MTFLPDNMSATLASMYPALPDTAARYYQWFQDNGPDWDSIVAHVEGATGLPFVDGWAVYWAGGGTPAPVQNPLLFSGDPILWFGDPIVFNP